MQGAEGMGKGCQLVTVTAKSAARELADLPLQQGSTATRYAGGALAVAHVSTQRVCAHGAQEEGQGNGQGQASSS